MLTLKIETVEDIQNAMLNLGRLPRKQRVDVLSAAKSKLLSLARSRGSTPEIQQLRLDVSRRYAREKERLDKQEPKFSIIDKSIYSLEVGEMTTVRDTGRFEGVQVGRDENGFFAKGPLGRTESHKWSGEITDEELENIVNRDNAVP